MTVTISAETQDAPEWIARSRAAMFAYTNRLDWRCNALTTRPRSAMRRHLLRQADLIYRGYLRRTGVID